MSFPGGSGSSSVNENEYLLVDDNNSHDGKGPKYAVLKRTAILVSEIDMDVTGNSIWKNAAYASSYLCY